MVQFKKITDSHNVTKILAIIHLKTILCTILQHTIIIVIIYIKIILITRLHIKKIIAILEKDTIPKHISILCNTIAI